MSNVFHIGQRVVCIKTHSEGVTRSGVVYVVKEMRTCPHCGYLALDVGVPSRAPETECAGCGNLYPSGPGWLQGSTRFGPPQEDSASSKLASDEAQRADKQEQQFKPELA